MGDGERALLPMEKLATNSLARRTGLNGAHVTDDLVRRGDHRSVQALEKDIPNWATVWTDNPKPFIWTTTAEQILEGLGRLIQRITGEGH